MDCPIVKERPETPGLRTLHETPPESILICPICSFEYAHVKRMYALMGNDPFEGRPNEDGKIYGVPVCGITNGERRPCAVLEVECEQGHRFAIKFQQHKGQTFVTTK
jgi:hypothetical protein